MNRAFIFPGQGSQIMSMGKDFYENFATARLVFEEVNHTLGYDLQKIIFNGPKDLLTLTLHAQPALMTVSIAMLRVLEQESGKSIVELCQYVAGHSLGEYTALCAANSITLSQAATLLSIRAKAMNDAASYSTGGMAACIGIDLQTLSDVIKGMQLDIANDNIENQIVISGDIKDLEIAINQIKALGYKAIKLQVSSAFHSRLMRNAEKVMESALMNFQLNVPLVNLVTNVTANVENDPEKIKQNLVKQICGLVKWRETLHFLSKMQVSEICEIGSGRVLSQMITKSGLYPFQVRSISTVSDMIDWINLNVDYKR